MIFPDEFPKIRGAEMVLLLSECILQIKAVDAELIGNHHIGLIRHSLRDPVMPPDRLKPPDLMDIGKGDPVHLIGSVLLEELSEAEHPLPGAVNVGEGNVDHVLFPDPADLLWPIRAGGNILHQRVRGEHALIARDRLRRRHGDIFRIHPRGGPDPILQKAVWHRRIAKRALRKLNFHMG